MTIENAFSGDGEALPKPHRNVDPRSHTSPSLSPSAVHADSAEMCVLRKHQLENDQNEATVESLATEFNAFGKVAAEQIILRGKTVAKAKTTFEYKDFHEFCRLVRLEPKSSTCRKYKLIGAEADWLQPIAENLPGDWTTIYVVVRLGQAKAEELIRLKVLHPQATAKELKAATTVKPSGANPADEPVNTTEPCVLQVDASDLADQDRLNLYLDLEETAARHGLSVTGLPKRLAETLIINREAA